MTERTGQYQRGRARNYIMVNANTYLLCLALGVMLLVVEIEKTAASTANTTSPTASIATHAGPHGPTVTSKSHPGTTLNTTTPQNSGNVVHGFSPLILISGLVTKLVLYL